MQVTQNLHSNIFYYSIDAQNKTNTTVRLVSYDFLDYYSYIFIIIKTLMPIIHTYVMTRMLFVVVIDPSIIQPSLTVVVEQCIPLPQLRILKNVLRE